MDSTVGFRFKPNDEEIIFLLKMKRRDPDLCVHTIQEIDIYKHEPWELSGFSRIQSKEEVWYFFCEPYYKYAKSKREHRRTSTGYWKLNGNGSDMKAKNSRQVIGKKRILSFISDRTVSKIANAKWIMHQITVEDDPLYKKDYVVCRLEKKRDTDKRKTRTIVSTSDDQSSQDLVSRNHVAENIMLIDRNHVAENTLMSSNRNHAAESTLLVFDPLREHGAESQILPIQSSSLVPYSRNPDVDAEFNPQGGCNVVNNALQSPINSEEGPSYSNGSNYGCGTLNTQSYNEHGDDQFSSPKSFWNESSSEESGRVVTPDVNSSKSDEHFEEATGQTSSPDFNSSKADGNVYEGNSSDMDTETFNSWVFGLFQH